MICNHTQVKKLLLINKIAHKADFRSIINAKCCECNYSPQSPGTWRQQVSNCNKDYCPLYKKRPRTYKKHERD